MAKKFVRMKYLIANNNFNKLRTTIRQQYFVRNKAPNYATRSKIKLPIKSPPVNQYKNNIASNATRIIKTTVSSRTQIGETGDIDPTVVVVNLNSKIIALQQRPSGVAAITQSGNLVTCDANFNVTGNTTLDGSLSVIGALSFNNINSNGSGQSIIKSTSNCCDISSTKIIELSVTSV